MNSYNRIAGRQKDQHIFLFINWPASCNTSVSKFCVWVCVLCLFFIISPASIIDLTSEINVKFWGIAKPLIASTTLLGFYVLYTSYLIHIRYFNVILPYGLLKLDIHLLQLRISTQLSFFWNFPRLDDLPLLSPNSGLDFTRNVTSGRKSS